MPEKRNIVLITLDSLRADHCSFMGYQRETTPTIDKMARDGLYFENAVAAGVPTRYSMFSIFTGDYLLISSDKEEDIRKEMIREFKTHKTLAQVLSEKGYKTAAFHANPWLSRLNGFDKGFIHFQDFISRDKASQLHTIIRKLPRIIVEKRVALTDWKKIYYAVLDWHRKVEEPYFLWVLLLDTHLPYMAPKKYRKFGNKSTLYLLYLNWKLRKAAFNPNIVISLRERERIINAYDDVICYADEFVNKLWSNLKDDDPIFIIHSDHGEGFGEHGFYYHPHMLYEELIHVPLIIYNADVKGKIEKPVSLRGLPSTILDLIGEKNEFPSESLLKEDNDLVVSKIFYSGERKVAVRMKDWKFIMGQKKDDELYYLKEDPYEQNNLINRYPKLAEEMRKIARRHIKHDIEKTKIRNKVLIIGVRSNK